jgi:hypothetical protein
MFNQYVKYTLWREFKIKPQGHISYCLIEVVGFTTSCAVGAYHH